MALYSLWINRALVFLLLVWTLLVGIACYYQPYITDDISGADYLLNHSLIDNVISSYNSFSGRIVYLLIGAIEQKYMFFSVVHGLAIVLLGLLVVKISFRDIFLPQLWKIFLIALALLLFWFGFYTLDTIVAWRSGSPYLWSLLIAAVFIFLYNYQPVNRYLVLFAGFCSGLMHEGISAGLLTLVLLTIVYEKHKSWKISRQLMYGTAGLIVGTALLIVAPGNYARFTGSVAEANGIIDFVYRYLGYCYKTITTSNVCLVYIVLLLLVIALRLWKNKKILMSLIFVVSGLVSLMLPAMTYTLERRFTAIPAFFFLLGTFEILAVLFEKYRDKFLSRTVLAAIVTVAMLFVLIWDSYNGLESEIAFNKLISEQEQAIISLRDSGVRDIAVYPITGKRHRLVYYDSITFDPKHWKNEILAKHYGINSIVLSVPK